ncbi:hypothetical protein [Isobaculum melis]|uniref:Uncharacterized protein n=1 Tax=Isobaculum melis TaxID=142588 RepID=A0A1H9U7N3_9LACT|nr:hypothetical protein [Isobaculum melis]SES05332.1 hypothetical protein SAMN04488559_1236 [Isobaculum melis]
MKNGEGDELLVLFKENACIINGFLHELQPLKTQENRPSIFHEFMNEEPVKSIGTTFCLWTDEQGHFQASDFEKLDTMMQSFIEIYQPNPKLYIDWACDYYELDGLPAEIVEQVYQKQALNQTSILSINADLEDWETLKSDLEAISYPFTFSK